MFTVPDFISQVSHLGALGAVCAVILFSYALEDLALVFAAILASTGVLSPVIAWAAAFIGIFTGDLGVYFIARILRKPVAAWRTDFPMMSTKELIICRFTPGLRTPAYSWCGLSKMPLLKFTQIIFWSGLVWTIGVFTLVYWSGQQLASYFTQTNWLIVPVVLLIIGLMRYRWKPSFLGKETVSHD